MIKPQFDQANKFVNRIAKVMINGKVAYINEKGKVLLKTAYTEAGDFHQGLAWILSNGKVGYIDTKGKLVIKPRFEPDYGMDTSAGDFQSNGLAPALLNGKWGFINKKGVWVIKPQFAWVRSISPAGFAVVGVQ
ncbi:KWG repeat protein [Brevibacillus sp. BC25]|nr:KWG repeat protein [Brevibacillus sp. BC25]